MQHKVQLPRLKHHANAEISRACAAVSRTAGFLPLKFRQEALRPDGCPLKSELPENSASICRLSDFPHIARKGYVPHMFCFITAYRHTAFKAVPISKLCIRRKIS
ncbi:MAG: hypothetical protein LBU06_08490 [Desulfovibrio sp.]|nr:hypothetical protein [Desulfovibrio sp.]